jgi:general secretion pathway protein M
MPTANTAAVMQGLRTAWDRLAVRERRAVGLAAAVVGLALLWGLGVAPALATLRQAPEQHRQLDAQLEQMRRLAASAERLRAQGDGPSLTPDAARLALQQATTTLLGEAAQLSVQGDRASLTLRGVPPDALARWLAQVRINARLTPLQADLQHSAEPPGWSGQLVLGGPGLGTGN